MSPRIVSKMGLVAVVAVSSVLAACSEPTYFPSPAYAEKHLPPRAASEVEVVFGDGTPGCDYDDMGTIVTAKYTTEAFARDAVVEEAARIGASGVYKMETSTGAVVGMSSSAGTRAEVSLKATAYFCKGPAPAASSDSSAKAAPSHRPK